MTKNQVKVGNLHPKSILAFTYGGIEWIVLDNKGENGVLCLARNAIYTKSFDKNNYNNWAGSSLRECLNDDFLREMEFNEYALKTDFMPMTTNLTTDDGLKDYGTCEDLISLISCSQYRQYRDIITCLDNGWWTCTPYSSVYRVSSFARVVDSDGTLSNLNVCDGKFGVRPLCTLKPETLVSKKVQQLDLCLMGEIK